MLRDSSSERAWARRDQPWSWHWVMSFLTTFPEDVYPMHRLAETIGRDTFDIELAQALMWMSQAAYETTADSCQEGGTPKLERILGRWGFACRARLSQGGTEGFVAESEAAIVVAFAGTDPVVAANWITDFNVRTDSDGIHRGFADGVEGIWPALVTALEGTAKPIFLVGHSLGGALAVVAAWRLTGDDQLRADQARRGGGIGVERIAGSPHVRHAARRRRNGLPRPADRAACGRKSHAWNTAATSSRRFPRGRRAARVSPRRTCTSLPARRAIQGFAAASTTIPMIRSTLAHLEELLGITDRETLRMFGEAWHRILDHGVPRSPAGGTATLHHRQAALFSAGSFAGLLP